MQTKQQYHVVLLTQSWQLWVGEQQQHRRLCTPVPLLLPRTQIWQPEPSSKESKPSLFGIQPFPSETSCPGWRAGSNQLDFFQKPGHKATGRSIKGINFLGSYRPSGNNSMLISAFPCAGEECRQHPPKPSLSKAPLPQETQQVL